MGCTAVDAVVWHTRISPSGPHPDARSTPNSSCLSHGLPVPSRWDEAVALHCTRTDSRPSLAAVFNTVVAIEVLLAFAALHV